MLLYLGIFIIFLALLSQPGRNALICVGSLVLAVVCGFIAYGSFLMLMDPSAERAIHEPTAFSRSLTPSFSTQHDCISSVPVAGCDVR